VEVAVVECGAGALPGGAMPGQRSGRALDDVLRIEGRQLDSYGMLS